MILSRRWRFLFIKGRKVAGTSVEVALSTICGPDDIITPITPFDETVRTKLGARGPQNHDDRFYNHMSFRQVLAFAGPLDSYSVFCVERSPYSKVISWANSVLTYRHYHNDGRPMRSSLDEIRQVIDKLSVEISIAKNIDLYRDNVGAIAAVPLRYHSLNSDLLDFLHRIGAPRVNSLPHLKEGLRSDTIDPREVLRRDHIDAINEIYAEEFDAFGYEMI